MALGMMVYMARNQFVPSTGSELKGKRSAYKPTATLVGW